uniref:Uncharacterized protein n=1 Tax=Molossus molossus TaxID=27622 RepID=A0A7J8JWE7_MOLMO|nr:hypothetical protein HJG59_008131 [Molossus molossus]
MGTVRLESSEGSLGHMSSVASLPRSGASVSWREQRAADCVTVCGLSHVAGLRFPTAGRSQHWVLPWWPTPPAHSHSASPMTQPGRSRIVISTMFGDGEHTGLATQQRSHHTEGWC